MDGESFTKLVKDEARDFAIEWSLGNNSGVSENVQKWVDHLSDNDKHFLREFVTVAIDNSLFQLFEIMDGVHTKSSEPIEASSIYGRISGKGLPQLHDLYANKI